MSTNENIKLEGGEAFGLTNDTAQEGAEQKMSDADKISIVKNTVTLRTRLMQLMSKMDKVNVSEKTRNTLMEFLVFHIQTDNMPKYYDNKEVSGNILVQVEDEKQGMEFANILKMEFGTKDIVEVREDEFIEDNKMDIDGMDAADIIVVDGCSARIRDNANCHDSLQRSEHQKKMKKYNGFWNLVCVSMEFAPEKIFIVVASEKVCRYTLEQNKRLYKNCISYKIEIEPYSSSQIYNMVIGELKPLGLDMSKEFKSGLREYIDCEMKKPGVHGSDFVKEISVEVTRSFFRKRISSFSLEKKHVPEIDNSIKTPEEIFEAMDELVGLDCIKSQLSQIYSYVLTLREHNAKPVIANPLHMIFTGNPGTGKTTVARLMADMFYSMGVIETNNCVVASAHDCISMYRHGTLDKVATLIENAMDGVLFIDEAYAFAADPQWSQDAIALLLEAAENMSDHIVIILAGYRNEMQDFMNMNPGIKHRFPRIIDFPDYSIPELMQIFEEMCDKEHICIDREATPLLEECFEYLKVQKDFANARTVRNVFARLAMSAQWQDNGDRVIKKEHVEAELPTGGARTLSHMVGLEKVKNKIHELVQMTAYIKKLQASGNTPDIPINMNMLFIGNPGTGKTTVAERIADELYGMKVLKTNNCLCIGRKDLVGAHVGETEKKTTQVLEQGYGGVIFIDEAYSLTNTQGNDYGSKVIEILLTAMEKHMEDTAFIFAGYPYEMEQFVASNPGIASRIQYKFLFEDYSDKELTQMFKNMCKGAGLKIPPKAIESFRSLADFFRTMQGFGNGRFVNQVFQQMIIKRSGRDFQKNTGHITQRDIPTIEEMRTILADSSSVYIPEKISIEDVERTAYHEAGHALAAVAAGIVPKKITIQNQVGMYGHVSLPDTQGHLTEPRCMDMLVMLLAGRNAERMMYGSASAGCSEDYRRAKRLANDMVNKYAMGELGVTRAMDFLKRADKLSMELLEENKAILESAGKLLMENKCMTGQEFSDLFNNYRATA